MCLAQDPFSYSRPYKWSGLYTGLQAGYTWSKTDAVNGPYAGPYNETFSYWGSGLFGGAHVGYNWQFGHYLFGAEADIDGSNFSNTSTGSLGELRQTKIGWQSTMRARLGWISGSWLIYGAGGLAYNSATAYTSVAGFSPYSSSSERQWGWTLGAGVERAIMSNATVRLEYRYLDFGKVSTSDLLGNLSSQSDLTTHQLRAGVSFRF
jgi:outer membrane immunogenic protein